MSISGQTLFISEITLATVSGLILFIVLISSGGRLYAVCTPLFFTVSSVGIVTTTGFSLAMQNYVQAAPLTSLGGGNSAIPMGLIIVLSNMVAFYMIFTRRKPGNNQ
nr:hypothetical protein [Paenibacillus polymyxa]